MTEVWKDIQGYEGFYKVSNLGRVKSLERGVRCGRNIRIVKEIILRPQGKRYLQVRLNSTPFLVHRLVALAFVPNVHNYKTVNHKDCDKHNNGAQNLEWCTHSENIFHAYRNGRINLPKGENHYTKSRRKDPVTKRWVAL